MYAVGFATLIRRASIEIILGGPFTHYVIKILILLDPTNLVYQTSLIEQTNLMLMRNLWHNPPTEPFNYVIFEWSLNRT